MSKSELIYGMHAVDALIEKQPERVIEVYALKGRDDERLNAIADVIDNKETETRAKNNISIGGYGEMHYNNLDVNGEEDTRELDFHRMVLFFGHEFNSRARFFTEFEVEHIIAGDGSRGAVELEHDVFVDVEASRYAAHLMHPQARRVRVLTAWLAEGT